MLVFDNIQKHPNGEDASYWTRLIDFDKDSRKYIIELGCSKPETLNPGWISVPIRSSLRVLVTEDELCEIACHVREFYILAHNMSEGKCLMEVTATFEMGPGQKVLEDKLKLDVDKVWDIYPFLEEKDSPIKHIGNGFYQIRLFYFVDNSIWTDRDLVLNSIGGKNAVIKRLNDTLANAIWPL